MSRALPVALFVVLFAVETRAAEVDVTAPEAVVRRAPFDVAPEVGRVHVGDKLTGSDQASGEWRFVQIPGGASGYLRDADVKVVLAPVPSVVPVPPGTGPAINEPAPPPVSTPAVVVVAAPASNTPAAPGDSTAPPAQIGVMFEMMPNGRISTSNSGASDTTADAAFAVAVAPYFDAALGTPYVSLGFSPQILLGVKGTGADAQSSTEYDFRARLTLRDPLSPQETVYFRFSPGYSVVSIANLDPAISNPKGPVFDFAVGSEINVGPKLIFVFDLGYQLGLQSTSDATGATADFNTRYLHVGVGFALGI